MTNAIAYVRISSKDQSNFSIDGQRRYITQHCTSNAITLLETFIDDGRSAKNFDRPDWKKLETFIQQHHKTVNYLVVVKYDRFSRNTAQGLQKIEWLEKKYNIVIVSVFEQMFVDYDSPFFFKQRADMLVTAEFELHVIRDRTKFGIHQALNSGRFMGKAPVGYSNARDDQNKPIIVINDTTAPIIRQVFTDYLAGHPFGFIKKKAQESGLKTKDRSFIPAVLSNPLYAGMVNVPAYRKQPTRIIDATHPAIVPKQQWYEVQRRLQYRKNPKVQMAAEVPLRANVSHTCGRMLTAGKSKGQRQNYWYYKFNTCPRTNYSAITMHKKFDDLLGALSFDRPRIEYMISEATAQMRYGLKERAETLVLLRKDLQQAIQDMESMEEKYIRNQIKADTYEKFHYRYSSQIASLNYQIKKCSEDERGKWYEFRAGLNRLENLQWIWNNADLMQKHEFLRLVFNSSLYYDGATYRTPYLLELFHHNLLTLKEKNLLQFDEAGYSNVKSMECTGEQT
ncbi:MAG: recombinase family protein [Bacteroidota bacterium]